METTNQINISHTKNSLIRNYLQLFLYIISISSLFSQVITPQILELDNKIFQLDDNLANACFADIDEQIDELKFQIPLQIVCHQDLDDFLKLLNPKDSATKLIPSVAPLTKMISFSDSTFKNFCTFFLDSS